MSKEWVEIGQQGLAIRIFRTKRAAVRQQLIDPHTIVMEMERWIAVGQIRQQVFERDTWLCIHCAREVTVESGELDERQARGTCVEQPDGEYQSGEVSVENCQTLCSHCHTGPMGKHDRSPSFSRGPNATLQT